MRSKRDRIFVGLVGISGVGKSTIAEVLSHDYGFTWLPSYTTREPREGDLPHEYEYVDVETFHRYEKQGRFMETAEHAGKHYALRKPKRHERGPFVSPINAEGIAYLIGHHEENRLQVVPVGLVPPDRSVLHARNEHVGEKVWQERHARDKHFGVQVPPPLLTGGVYEMTLINHNRYNVAWMIDALLESLIGGVYSPPS